MAAINALLFISAGTIACAVSVEKFTVADTPEIEFNARSIDATHEEHVIPSMLNVIGSSALELFAM